MRPLLLACFLLMLSSFCYAVERTEEILNFISDISVNTDTSIDVTEKITVYANQNQIKQGITRSLPSFYTDSSGKKHHLTYQIQQVLIDQLPTSYHLERKQDQLNIITGNKNQNLEPGTYIYTFHYRINNLIRSLKNQDEIVWNVTGNQWPFPIVSTTAEVWTPGKATVLKYNGHTEASGKKTNDFSTTLPASNEIVFHIQKPLNAGESFTIAAAWPKGFIQKPSVAKQIQHQLQQTNQADFISLSIILILMSYYCIVGYAYKTSQRNNISTPTSNTLKMLYIPGILTLLAFAIVILSAVDKTQTLFAAFWLSIWTLSCCILLSKMIALIKQTFRFFSFVHLGQSILFVILFAIFLGTEFLGVYVFSKVVPPITLALLFTIVATNIAFYYLLRVPSRTSRGLLNSSAMKYSG